MRSNHRSHAEKLATLALATLTLSACGRHASAPTHAMPPVPVLTAPATRRTVPNQLREIGTVEAFATVNIKSRVEGHLVAIHFREGDFVSRNQLLFSLDERPARAALQQAEANLTKDQAQARQAVTDAGRYAFLEKQGVGSRQQADVARASAATWTATAAADQAAVETAQLNLQYTAIHSPIDGRTGNLQAHIGDLIKPDADTPLVTLTQIQPIYVDFSIPERELPAVRENMQRAPLEIAAISPGAADIQEPSERGVLSFIDNTVDKTTGTILLKGLFQNDQRRLWPGAFVNAVLTINQVQDAIVVPSEALQTSQEGSFVFVVGKDMKVQMRPVTTGAQIDGNTVIERGLTAGETVVTDGQLRLQSGATVMLKQGL